jgi:hypothetical protein
MKSLRRTLQYSALCCALALAGCRPSPYVQTTITNATGDALQQLQVDYPSASFGKDKLPDNASFLYRFKIQGSGAPHIEFTDSSGKQHKADGPPLSEGESGTLDIRITPGYSVTWQPMLHR